MEVLIEAANGAPTISLQGVQGVQGVHVVISGPMMATSSLDRLWTNDRLPPLRDRFNHSTFTAAEPPVRPMFFEPPGLTRPPPRMVQIRPPAAVSLLPGRTGRRLPTRAIYRRRRSSSLGSSSESDYDSDSDCGGYY